MFGKSPGLETKVVEEELSKEETDTLTTIQNTNKKRLFVRQSLRDRGMGAFGAQHLRSNFSLVHFSRMHVKQHACIGQKRPAHTAARRQNQRASHQEPAFGGFATVFSGCIWRWL